MSQSDEKVGSKSENQRNNHELSLSGHNLALTLSLQDKVTSSTSTTSLAGDEKSTNYYDFIFTQTKQSL